MSSGKKNEIKNVEKIIKNQNRKISQDEKFVKQNYKNIKKIHPKNDKVLINC